MADHFVSVDEYLSARAPFVKSGDVLVKAARAPASWNDETRTARFVMSAEVEDRDRDIVYQAGLDLTGFLANPVAPWSHRSGEFPVGTWSNIEKLLNGRPKRTEGDLTLVPKGVDGVADRLAFHIANGSIKACSIGFVPKEVRRRAKEEGQDGWTGYDILSAEMVECSPCVVPSNPAALAKSAHEGDVIAREIIEEILDTWTKNPATGLIVPRADFESAYKQASGERTSITAPPMEAAPVTDTQATDGPAAAVTPPLAAEAESLTRPQARSLIRRALDLVFGEENEAQITAALQAQAADDEREAAKEAERAAQKQALAGRLAAAEARLAAKGI